jgi:5-methylcytosine-specific restriction protein A
VRSTPEWQGKTDDSAIPVRVKLRVHAKAEGCCAKCGVEATTGQYDHAISLILGGENRESNLQFLCVPCHKAKTKLDVKIKAKVARVRARHIGLKKPSRFPAAETASSRRRWMEAWCSDDPLPHCGDDRAHPADRYRRSGRVCERSSEAEEADEPTARTPR